MSFPLVLLPRNCVLVDDDADFLEMLKGGLSPGDQKSFWTCPSTAKAWLDNSVDYWRGITHILGQAQRERSDGVGEAAYYLRTYFTDWRRFHLPTVLFIDYSMPGTNGLDVLADLQPSPMRKVLLTGQADTELAIEAFNQQLIDQYVSKSGDVVGRLEALTTQMHAAACDQLGQLLYPLFTTKQLELFQSAAFSRALTDKVRSLEWTEYVAVGDPFGLLGIDAYGQVQWLQLETLETVKDLARMVGSSLDAVQMNAVLSGKLLPNHEFLAKVQSSDEGALVVGGEICLAPPVFCGVTELSTGVLSQVGHGVACINSGVDLVEALVDNVARAYRSSIASPAPLAERLGPDDVLFVALHHLTGFVASSPANRRELDRLLGATSEAALKTLISFSVAPADQPRPPPMSQ